MSSIKTILLNMQCWPEVITCVESHPNKTFGEVWDSELKPEAMLWIITRSMNRQAMVLVLCDILDSRLSQLDGVLLKQAAVMARQWAEGGSVTLGDIQEMKVSVKESKATTFSTQDFRVVYMVEYTLNAALASSVSNASNAALNLVGDALSKLRTDGMSSEMSSSVCRDVIRSRVSGSEIERALQERALDRGCCCAANTEKKCWVCAIQCKTHPLVQAS